jgi:hypothetical protein
VSEWLDLMLDEIRRKQREEREALQEAERRAEIDKKASKPPARKRAQPK